jgi:hypothetical protein
MNTIIDFIFYAVGILMLLLVPAAVIAGSLASRYVVISFELGNDHSGPDVRNQNAVSAFTGYSNERSRTIASTLVSGRS